MPTPPPTLAMLGLGVRRLRSTPELTFGLLVGLVSVIALVSSIPAYVEAANKQILREELGSISRGQHPAFAFMYNCRRQRSASVRWEEFEAADVYLTARAPSLFGLPLEQSVLHVQSEPFSLFFAEEGQSRARQALASMRAGFVRDLLQHVVLVEGSAPSVASPEGAIEVLFSEGKANTMGVRPGDRFILFYEGPAASGGSVRFEETIQVAGIWRPNDPAERFWFISHQTLEDVLLVPEASYVGRLRFDEHHDLATAKWYHIFDGSAFEARSVPGFLSGIYRVQAQLPAILPGTSIPLSPEWALVRYQKAVNLQTKVLFTFSIPLFGLAVGYIVFVSTLLVRQQRLEIALLRSRGATTSQIAVLYSVQGMMLSLISLGLGLLAGRFLAQMMGRTQAFLAFGQGQSMAVQVTVLVWQYSVVAIGLALLLYLLPTLRWAGFSVVTFKRFLARTSARPWWQRTFLDVLLLGIALYGYSVLRRQGNLSFLLGGSGDPFQDPLLLLVPSFFALSGSLLFVRAFPPLMTFLAWGSRLLASVVPVLTFRRLSRSGNYSVILMLLTLTVSLAAFTASLALTLDNHMLQRAYYQVGADMSLQELGVISGSTSGLGGNFGSGGEDNLSIYVLPATDAAQAPGVESATRVATLGIRSDTAQRGTLLGVDRIGLPRVAFFRHDFADRSLGALMNELALNREAALVSEDFLSEHGLRVGDHFDVRINNPENTRVRLSVAGGLRLFPTIYSDPVESSFFVVANLRTVEEALGYPLIGQLWLALDSNEGLEEIVDQVEGQGFRISSAKSAWEYIEKEESQLERIGLFGFLSVGFATISFLSMSSLVIRALLLIRQEAIQFGILRALGLSLGQLVQVVLLEQFVVVLVGLAAGTALGIGMSYLFLPFLQVSYAEKLPPPPLLVQIAWQDLWKVYALIGAALVVAIVSLIGSLLRLKMFEAIKMGEAQSL